MGLWRDFFTGKLHVYYGLLALCALSIYEIVNGHYLWLIPLIVCDGCLVDLYIHCYAHAVQEA